MIDPQKAPHPWREHECTRGHAWRAPVRFAPTRNLSGEQSPICPTCAGRPVVSLPWTLQDGSPYPLDEAPRVDKTSWPPADSGTPLAVILSGRDTPTT